MDNVISGFHQIMNTDIAWADGPGWLLGLVVGWIVMLAIAART